MGVRLVTCLLVKNEADRYLHQVLKRCAEFSDDILVLDDGSTDDTIGVAKSFGCIVKQRPKAGAWGNEAPARAELWERGVKCAKDGWLLICDADQILHGDPRPLTRTWEANAWAWPLLDLWDNETRFRTDGYWQGYKQARVWMVKPSAVPRDWGPVWGDRGLHCGHIPPNFPLAALIAPDSLYWLHYGWLREEDRIAKYHRYKNHSTQLTSQELAHVESILTAAS